MRTWASCFGLAVPAAGMAWLGAPFWLALTVVFVFLFAVIGHGRARTAGRVALPLVLAAAVVSAVVHATAGPAVPGPAVVTFQDGTYSSYGNPSFRVDAINDGASAGTVHSIRVRFVNERTAQVITDVTVPAEVTIPAGRGQALTYSAPRAVTRPAVLDRDILVTVTGWT